MADMVEAPETANDTREASGEPRRITLKSTPTISGQVQGYFSLSTTTPFQSSAGGSASNVAIRFS